MITQALIDEAITSRDAPWTSEEWKHVHQQAQSDALYFIGWRKHLQENFQVIDRSYVANCTSLCAQNCERTGMDRHAVTDFRVSKTAPYHTIYVNWDMLNFTAS